MSFQEQEQYIPKVAIYKYYLNAINFYGFYLNIIYTSTYNATRMQLNVQSGIYKFNMQTK